MYRNKAGEIDPGKKISKFGNSIIEPGNKSLVDRQHDIAKEEITLKYKRNL